jgi:hypothetical protein
VKIYADFLLARGFRQVIESIREDLYWTSGSEVIRRRVEPAGVRVTRVPVNSEDSASTISDPTGALAGAESRSIALLLVGYPQPPEAIVRALADRSRRPCPVIFRRRWLLEAWQLSEQIIGRLLEMLVDAMSGMVTQVRPPRRDEMNAYYRALPLCDPGKLQPNRHTGDANA